MLILAADYERCHTEVLHFLDAFKRKPTRKLRKEYEFHARQYIRAVFAYIEALTYSVKAKSAWRCMRYKIPLSSAEQFLSIDMSYEVNDKGVVVETPARISLAKNIRFAIALSRRADGVEKEFNASAAWWSSMKNAIRVRDRLTHPKLPGDLDIGEIEVAHAARAVQGLLDEVIAHREGAA
jgi:hypothetical protein